MILRRRTRSLDAAFFVLVVALFSNVSRGAELASGDKPAPEKSATKPARKNVKLPGLVIDFQQRCVDLEGSVCLEEGMLELVACTKGTKEHESIVAIEARPMHVHAALLLLEVTKCTGRGGGGKPKGAFITKEFLVDFQGGKVSIAVKTFLRFNHKYKVKPTERIPQGRISIHFEEMKIPPLGDDLVIKSAAVVPMLSSEWQAKQDPDNRELQSESDKFLYDGKFVANPKVLGAWQMIDQVKSIDEFTPEKKMNPGRALFTRITFKDNGQTDQPLWIWSGDTLMDLDRYQALKMTVKKIDGSDYLFIEAGGFSTRNPVGWQSPLYVMKRQTK